MDTNTLVNSHHFGLDAGASYLQQLTACGVPVLTAAWLRRVDETDWHLFVVSPLVDKYGASRAYAHLRFLQDSGKLLLIYADEVRLLSPGQPLSAYLGSLSQQSQSEVYMRSFDGRLEDYGFDRPAYVYTQLHPVPAG